METVITALSGSLKDVADTAMTAVGTVVPYAIPFIGIGIAVGVVVKIFKKVANK